MRQPGVDGHVRHDPRTVDEARLRGDEEQPCLGGQRDGDEPGADFPPAEVPAAGDPLEQDGVHRLVVRRMRVHEQVREDDAARGDGQRRRHQPHRVLRGANLRLAHDLDAVRDGLDARVRAAAERVRADEEQERAEGAERRDGVPVVDRRLMGHRRDLTEVSEDGDAEEDGVRHDEGHEDRKDRLDRLLHAPNVEHDEQPDRGDLEDDLGTLNGVEPRPEVFGRDAAGGHAEPGARDHAEDSVPAGRDRRRDGQDVIDEERRAADDAEPRAQELGGDHVAAAARRKMLDDPRVGVGDDEDGERRTEREPDGQRRKVVAIRHELAERGLRAVGRGRKAVGAEPYPRQHRDERDAVEGLFGVNVLGRTEYERPDLLPHGAFAAFPLRRAPTLVQPRRSSTA